MSTSTPRAAHAVEPLTPERRRQQTREHLLEAAARVFAERGFHGATMDEVAAAAGFTKGAVYSNFKNKEDLFLALFDARSEMEFEEVEKSLANRMQGAEGETDAGDVELTTRLLFGDPEFHLLSLEFTLYAARHEEIRRKLAERQRAAQETLTRILDAEREKRGLDPATSSDNLAPIYLALFNGIGLRHLIDPETVDERAIKSAITFLMGTLAPE